MGEYDPKNLQSTLLYIKDRFGISCFHSGGNVSAYLSDLAPSLINERKMIQKFDSLHILDDFINAIPADETTKRRVYAKSMTILVDSEFIRNDIAESYLSTLADVFGWEIVFEPPAVPSFPLRDVDTASIIAVPPGCARIDSGKLMIIQAITYLIGKVKNQKMNAPMPDYQKQLAENRVSILSSDSHSKLWFDKSRYLEESGDPAFKEAQQLVWNGSTDKAKEKLMVLAKNGSTLAGALCGAILLNDEDPTEKTKGYDICLSASKAGNPLAAAWMSEALKTGKGAPMDVEMSEKLFQMCRPYLEEMALSGSAEAQYFLGFNLVYGIGCVKNYEKAFDWLSEATRLGYPSAGAQLAIMYREGIGVPADKRRSFEILEQFANSKNKKIDYNLGKAYYLGIGTNEDNSRAAIHFLRAAEAGNKFAQDYLGDMYLNGYGFAQDDTKAFEWYKKSAEQGCTAAQYSLSQLYYFGTGTERNKEEAAKYLRLAAEKDHRTAQYEMFEDCLLNRQNDEAFTWLKKSAENGYIPAQIVLARMYAVNDYGFKTDDDQFVYWISKAAKTGDAEAQRILGQAYLKLENPKALPYDIYKAEELLHSASQKGDIQATIWLSDLYLDKPELGASQDQIRSYLKLAEQNLDHLVSIGKRPGHEYFSLAETYDSKIPNGKAAALGFYWRAFQNKYKKLESLEKVANYHFVDQLNNDALPNDEDLLHAITSHLQNADHGALECLVGDCYLNGRGSVKKDPEQAKPWLLSAAKHGYLPAFDVLAENLISNPNQADVAFRIAETAYKCGSPDGARLLGICYQNGIGTKKSRSKAKDLFKESANKGNEKAKIALKEMSFFGRR